MKKIEREEIKKVTVIDGYEAMDGTFFKSEEECLTYEQSAIGVLKGRLIGLAVRTSTEYGLFEAGSEDIDAIVVIPKDKGEVDLINQLALAINGDACRKVDDSCIGTVVIVYTGYQNDGCWMVALDDYVKDITNGMYTIKPVES